jgi:CRISPR-associated protein Csb2
MERALAVEVHLHDNRYHGVPEWPPAPARLFQAFVAGLGPGPLSNEHRAALQWLESLSAPIIGSPNGVPGQGFTTYVPNNDLDAVAHDPRRVAEIRVGKRIQPRLLVGTPAFVYLWHFSATAEDAKYADVICSIANGLYQFGRGVDMAWARGEQIDAEQAEFVLQRFSGTIHRPAESGSVELDCPFNGSLASLDVRYRRTQHRFKIGEGALGAGELFEQAPRAEFESVAYDASPFQRLFELQDPQREAFAPWPLRRAAGLVVALRDRAVERLKHALPERADEVERALVGRKPDGADAGPIEARVRIVPLPSIGHQHADFALRRVLLRVPPECPLVAADVFWAFAGADLTDEATGQIHAFVSPSPDQRMVDRFVERRHLWQTVTPAALPEASRRRRIDPARIAVDVKGGPERMAEEMRACSAVVQALRHERVRVAPKTIRVQREPFHRRGERAEAFAETTRFPKERLWHVQIEFAAPIAGPLTIGDGRFVGLGVMAPVEAPRGVYAFSVESGMLGKPSPVDLTRSLRRAVMVRVQHRLGLGVALPVFVSGHEPNGDAARSSHLAYVLDPGRRRLLVLAPHIIEKRPPTREELDHIDTLDDALDDFRELKAGPSGLLTLRTVAIEPESDPLFATSRSWESVTRYEVIRHTKGVGAARALSQDIDNECNRVRLPPRHVSSRELRGVAGGALSGCAHLRFEAPVSGPVLLGRSRYLGGGLFCASSMR